MRHDILLNQSSPKKSTSSRTGAYTGKGRGLSSILLPAAHGRMDFFSLLNIPPLIDHFVLLSSITARQLYFMASPPYNTLMEKFMKNRIIAVSRELKQFFIYKVTDIAPLCSTFGNPIALPSYSLSSL